MGSETSPRGANAVVGASDAQAGIAIRFVQQWEPQTAEQFDASIRAYKRFLFVHGLPPYPPLGYFDSSWPLDPNAPK